MEDKDLIEALRGGKERYSKALRFLYDHPTINGRLRKMILESGGNAQDVEDVLQEAILRFFHNIRNDRFQRNSSVTTYFLGISRNVWRDMQKKNRKVELTGEPVKPEATRSDNPEKFMLEEEHKEIVRRLLAKLGDPCQNILTLYMSSYSMKEIADILSLRNEDNAKKRTYRCRKDFRELLHGQPRLMALLRTYL